MSVLHDHARCLEILHGEDNDARKFVEENLKHVKMTLGKHKGKVFQTIFLNDARYVWWVCNMANSKTPTLLLFKHYCQSNRVETKNIKQVFKIYHDRDFKQPPKTYMRHVERRSAFCRLCDAEVDVNEKFTGDECSVCGFGL